MLSPLEPGTLLNQRYRIIERRDRAQLPYRTYLARDEGRFNEPCVLAELPFNSAATEEVKAKLRDRFQEEANKLYRLQHRQVAGVQATFEYDGRLFLAIAHREGPTLRELLEVRQRHGAAFDEAEIRQLLESLLPILDYLHRHNIVHGQISPETIALRADAGETFENEEGEPVLTDFGAIADLAQRFQAADGESLPTVAPRIGYTPPEQRHTGQANPSSDLYALAATAVVLLTGKEPEELYEPLSQQWQWQSFAPRASTALKEILEKMLQPQARDRYEAALEVRQALQTPPAPIAAIAPPPPTPTPPPTTAPTPPPAAPTPQPPETSSSESATVAVGRPRQTAKASPPQPPVSPARQREVSIPEPKDALLDNPLFLAALTLLVAVIAGGGAWGLANLLSRSRSTQTPESSPSVEVAESPAPTPSPTPSLSPTPSPSPASERTRRIPLLAGESFTERNALSEGAIANYVIPARARERLLARLRSNGVLLKILKPDGEPLSQEASSVKLWQGTLPAAGDYTVQTFLIPGSEAGDTEYELQLRLEEPVAEKPAIAPSPSPSPSSSPSPSPSPSPSSSPSPTPSEPTIDRETVTYPATLQGEPLELTGSIDTETVKRYLVEVREGQALQAAVLQGQVRLDIRTPEGRLVEDAEGIQLWEGQVSQAGLYQIDVRGDRAREFKISIAVREVEQ